jgi:NAD(P)-dependent dehydrogenase (short-subunit alcohol dehydrogenase family)
MGRLQDKVAIVTGGAKGLGAAFAQALVGEGARVAALDIASSAPVPGATALRCDVSNPDACRAAVAQVTAALGPPDILVNNAALYATLPMQRYDEIDPALWDQVMAVNLRGAFNMVQATGPGMEERGHGRIIQITSGTVYKGLPNMLHYITSKGGLSAMTKALSRELGPKGITVNALAPGLTLSDSILANADHVAETRAKVIASRAIPRDGLPEDLLGALIFLASDEAAFVTGQTIVVDGGSVNT